MNQQGYISMIDLDVNIETDYQLKNKNGAYFFLIEGEISVEDNSLERRDAIGIWETDDVKIKASKKSKLLIVDIPMR